MPPSMYTPAKVDITTGELAKLKRALPAVDSKKKRTTARAISIKVLLRPNQNIKSSQHTLLLTQNQIKAIESGREKKTRRYKIIRMSARQAQKNRTHPGGFLGALLGTIASRALPALAKGVASGLLSGLRGGDGLYMFKRGHCVKVDPVKENGLYLRNGATGGSDVVSPPAGDGLYLRKGNSLQRVGSGLLLGRDSPFKHIPILGSIL